MYDCHCRRQATLSCVKAPSQLSSRGEEYCAGSAELVNLAMVGPGASGLACPRREIIPDPIDAKKWTDTSLGCPQAGQTYNPGDITGYAITLKVKDQNDQEVKYIYHTDLERFIFESPDPSLG